MKLPKQTENVDYVVCKICGIELRCLTRHLIIKHETSVDEYKKKFGTLTVCKNTSKKLSALMTATNKKYNNQASEAGKESHIKHPNLKVDAVKRLRQWRKDNPELYLKTLQKTGKRTHELHPNLAHSNGKLVHQLHPEISERLPYHNIQWKKNCPEEHHAACSKGGKRTHEMHPNMASENGKKVYKMYPNMASDNQKKAFKNFPGLWSKVMSKMMNDWKNEDPKSFYAHQKKAGKLGGKRVTELYQPELGQKNMENIKKKYPNFHEIGNKASWEARLENMPYLWNGIKFLSDKEMQVAKIILDKPVKGANCHIRINNKIVDFYLEDKNLFVEYHPWDMNGLSEEQYYNQRRQIIDNSCYNNVDLIVITSLEEAKQMNWIKEEC